MKSWETKDQGLLKELHDAFKVRATHGLSLIQTMTTNRLALTLEDDRELLLYIFDTGRLTWYNRRDRQESYAIDVEGVFVDTLRRTIQATTREAVHFYYDTEVTVSP